VIGLILTLALAASSPLLVVLIALAAVAAAICTLLTMQGRAAIRRVR
jgi:hypothetical protein